MTTTQKPKRNYVNNKDLYAYLVEYRRMLEADPNAIIPNNIGEDIQAICRNLSKRLNFSGYSFKEEMVEDATLSCIAAVSKFDTVRFDKPFAYFTRIAWNSFVSRINDEQKQQYIRHKLLQNFHIMNDMSGEEPLGSFRQTSVEMNSTSSIVEKFEAKKGLTKPKKSVKVGIEKFTSEE